MSNTMWGGRFTGRPAEAMEEINASIDFDRKLAAQDIAASEAHLAMLAAQGIVEAADAEAIAKGLAQVRGEIEAGTFSFSRALEDIHMNVESRLAEIVGPAAGRLHTARSRNDQVAHRFSSTARPLKSASVSLSPSSRWKAIWIARRGSLATWSAASSPLARGASLAASLAESAGQSLAVLPAGASVPYRTTPAATATSAPRTGKRTFRRRGFSSRFVMFDHPRQNA